MWRKIKIELMPEIRLNFLISNFRRVLNIVCVLWGISLASDCHNLTPGKYPKYPKEHKQD
jgi:hypothetical protein